MKAHHTGMDYRGVCQQLTSGCHLHRTIYKKHNPCLMFRIGKPLVYTLEVYPKVAK